MKKVEITPSDLSPDSSIKISGSKSESNRVLILNSIFKNIKISNLSDSDDTVVLKNALENLHKSIDIHHAGTAMRFLTAYLSTLDGGKFILTGSKRMKERPIGILVDALKNLGFNINYLKKKGYPPLEINGTKSEKSIIKLKSDISSQFISALILIGPTFKNGLTIELDGEIISKPYINLTLNVLKRMGIGYSFRKNIIKIDNVKEINPIEYLIESDWSSSSYFYSIVAIDKKINIKLSNFFKESFQGDSFIEKIFVKLGVKTEFLNQNEILLSPIDDYERPSSLSFNLIDNPDLAQTVAVTCLALKIQVKITGLQTLKIKETDRILALHNELSKLGAKIIFDDASIEIIPPVNFNKNIEIFTYDDHRMALSFAPLGLITPLIINDPDVVTKSFRSYWNDLLQLNFNLKFKN
jgi:3-phosphoshikimate 1-carboxyvinyltransferase